MCNTNGHPLRWPASTVLANWLALGRQTVVAATALLVLGRPAVAIPSCVGDCSEDSQVTIDEVLTMVNVALGTLPASACLAGDADGGGTISIDEILSGVNHALMGCAPSATPTPTVGEHPSYVGDYYGSAPSAGAAVRFHVAANGAADGFLDFVGNALISSGSGESAAADVLASYPATGQANLDTGTYQLGGSFSGNDFSIAGQLPASPDSTGTLNVTVFGTTSDGTLQAGTPPPSPTATPMPGCDTANLQMDFSDVSNDFNGIASNVTVEQMNIAIEQPAPDYIAGLHETYNSIFNGTECTQQGQRLRDLQVSFYGVLGGLAAGQSFPVGTAAFVAYGEEGSGGDRVWAASAGTLFIDGVDGNVVQLRVVGAAMTETAGAATGRFTLNVSGQVNNFTRQSF
jgi:hypothetical protein